MNKLQGKEGKENVFDVIDDAAQVLFRMPVGVYRDELNNTLTVERTGETTIMILEGANCKFIVECIEGRDQRGKITSIFIENKDEKYDLYTGRGMIPRCENGMRSERGRLMMSRLIKKLQTCTPCQQQVIHDEIRSDILEATGKL